MLEGEVLAEHREDRQVDQVTGAADEAEPDELQPVRPVSGTGTDPGKQAGGDGLGPIAAIECGLVLFGGHLRRGWQGDLKARLAGRAA